MAGGLTGAALIALMLGVASAANAQSYPEKPVKIIVPSTPGGAIDITGRIIGGKLSEYWGQPVVVENRPGATMIIGAEAAAKSPADGYTLFVAHDGTMAMNPVIYPNLSYDSQRDFAPISMIAKIPLVLFVHNSVAANSVADLVALAKANPGKLNHAAGGTATVLAIELFKYMAGVNIVNVQYKGAANAVASTVGGETQICFADLGSAKSGLESGHVRPLGVATLQRASQRPDLPTIDASGVPGYEDSTWMALFAPAATPKPILAKIEADVARALKQPEVRQRFESLSMEMQSGTSDELRRVLASDIDKWSKVVKTAGLRFDPP
jgi:tripartite-type tricarboxylate transporter receptor subunit TctC